MKSEALKLSLTDRLELAQALIKSFHPQSKPKVIDKQKPPNPDDFRIEPDPVVTVDAVTEAPRRIAIKGTELPPSVSQSLEQAGKIEPSIKVDGSNSINQAFQKLRSALETETES